MGAAVVAAPVGAAVAAAAVEVEAVVVAAVQAAPVPAPAPTPAAAAVASHGNTKKLGATPSACTEEESRGATHVRVRPLARKDSYARLEA